jgi:predicted RNA-binding Zn-ribbon protein involved in translation (DUF1610 family)
MTKLVGYTCPDCDERHKKIHAARVEGALQIECPRCGNIESIPQTPNQQGVAGR